MNSNNLDAIDWLRIIWCSTCYAVHQLYKDSAPVLQILVPVAQYIVSELYCQMALNIYLIAYKIFSSYNIKIMNVWWIRIRLVVLLLQPQDFTTPISSTPGTTSTSTVMYIDIIIIGYRELLRPAVKMFNTPSSYLSQLLALRVDLTIVNCLSD